MKCDLKNITIHYETFGEGKPIVMLHGWPIDHRVMVSTMEPIFQDHAGWKRIYPDLPGMGQTPGMDWITNQDQVLEIVLEFVENIVPGERFAAAGYSYGGYLGLGMVYLKPELMNGLCLIAPAVVGDYTRRDVPSHTTLVKDPELVSDLEQNLADAFQNFAVVQSRELLDSMVEVGLPARKIADHEYLNRLSNNFEFSFDVGAPAKPFGGPTLMVMGRQDSSCGYRDAWDILENFPRGTYAVLDRAGHGLMVEQRKIFNALVNEWLFRVAEYDPAEKE